MQHAAAIDATPLSGPARLYFRRERAGHFYLVGTVLLGVISLALLEGALAPLGLLCVLASGMCGASAVWQYGRATDAAVGERSEATVRSCLEDARPRLDALARALTGRPDACWRIEHSVDLGRGDIDHVLCPTGGPSFVIETKTSVVTADHLQTARNSAVRFSRGGEFAVWSVIVHITPGPTRRVGGYVICSTANLPGVLAELYRAFRANPAAAHRGRQPAPIRLQGHAAA